MALYKLKGNFQKVVKPLLSSGLSGHFLQEF